MSSPARPAHLRWSRTRLKHNTSLAALSSLFTGLVVYLPTYLHTTAAQATPLSLSSNPDFRDLKTKVDLVEQAGVLHTDAATQAVTKLERSVEKLQQTLDTLVPIIHRIDGRLNPLP